MALGDKVPRREQEDPEMEKKCRLKLLCNTKKLWNQVNLRRLAKSPLDTPLPTLLEYKTDHTGTEEKNEARKKVGAWT